MPPKKKGGKGSGKKKKGKKSGKKSASAPAGEQFSELTKEFYLVQIRDLENRLDRYQKRCDELEVANGQFRDKYNQMGDDKKEIVSFLKKSLEQRGEEISDLNDRLVGLQQSKDAEKDQYEGQLGQLRTDFQEMKDSLTSENMILGGKLASLEEFKVQKEELMAKMESLEEGLKEQETLHEDEIYKLERKQVVDKDRLKKEMVMRVNQVAAEFRKVSNKQMAETTKRTIRENVSINAQLNKMSDKTMEMIQENDDIRTKEKEQRQLIEVLEHTEKELAKKNHSNQKIIRMLTEKCKTQEQFLAEYEAREEQYQELEAENELYRQQVESSRDEAQQLAKDNELLEEEIKRVHLEIAETRQNKQKMEKVLRDAAVAIRQALKTHPDEDADESEFDVIEKRDSMLENLLILLNSAAAIGVGPTLVGFAKSEPAQNRTRSPMPGSGKGIQRGEIRSVPASAPHYQLGDLGLIPRPQQHIPTSFDKTRHLSQTTRLGTLRKVLTSTVGTQTVSGPKAMFFADQLIGQIPAGSLPRLDSGGGMVSGGNMAVSSGGSQRQIPNKVF